MGNNIVAVDEIIPKCIGHSLIPSVRLLKYASRNAARSVRVAVQNELEVKMFLEVLQTRNSECVTFLYYN